MKSVDRILATLLFIFHFSFLFSLGTEYEYPLRLITSVFLGACCTRLWKKMKKKSIHEYIEEFINLFPGLTKEEVDITEKVLNWDIEDEQIIRNIYRKLKDEEE